MRAGLTVVSHVTTHTRHYMPLKAKKYRAVGVNKFQLRAIEIKLNYGGYEEKASESRIVATQNDGGGF